MGWYFTQAPTFGHTENVEEPFGQVITVLAEMEGGGGVGENKCGLFF